MNRHRIPRFFIGLLFIVGSQFSAVAIAEEAEHSALTSLKTATYNMVESLKQASKAERGDAKFIRKLVDTHLSPNIDFIASSKWVLGKYWRRASLDEKKAFIREFRTLLVQFYSTALAEYAISNKIDHGMLDFLPIRNDAKDEDITIHSKVNTPSGKVIPVNYHVHKTSKGWKVYDVSVEGVSMITTYRSSFAAELKQNGVSGIIESLKQRNAKLANSQAPSATKLVKN